MYFFLAEAKIGGMDKKASEIIDALGGTCAVARLCGGIKPPSVTKWRTNGIPQARLMFLKAVRPDVFGIAPARRGRKPAREAAA